MSMALQLALEASMAERVIAMERRAAGNTIPGDFEGSVDARWVRLDETGAGIVSYEGKEYVTKMIGTKPIPEGTAVELSYAGGIYFAKY